VDKILMDGVSLCRGTAPARMVKSTAQRNQLKDPSKEYITLYVLKKSAILNPGGKGRPIDVK
jgi:hypothetical protein